ncbi:MAG: DUF5107 domain-containing protein [Treponema sp.]|jgi:tetratricopeptide (TPR) repeat protein|nr:DUF5107 domain-containing protein [Treponema sp.]
MGASLIRLGRLLLKGSPLEGRGAAGAENPQPFFRGPDLSVRGGPGFPKDKYRNFGRETGFRALPYTMQDRYTRELTDMEFPSIVMENDFLRAECIPALGGRLWSLFDKRRNRDIVYRNPVFRPANLAIRDAWFSGGIEWNIGRLGHSVHTCAPVFAGVFTAEKEEVLRLWEFERQTGLFWRIECTLPEDSGVLFVYTRISNPDQTAKPLYWWTNAAVPQRPGVRVFSAGEEVIYLVPGAGTVKTMDYGRLPYLPVMPGRDASYPELSPYANEYFFQNDRVCGLPWESAVYADGYAYGEMATAPLVYRKLFCWGKGRGGRRWQDFLSLPGGEYLEVQAGLAPTQLHSADIAAGETVDWVQAFTAFQMEPERAFQSDYRAASRNVGEALALHLEPASLEAALKRARARCGAEAAILSMGSGWGALERRLGSRQIPAGLSFPDESVGRAEAPWAELIGTGAFPPRPVEAGPGSFAVDAAWEALLAAAPGRGWLGPYHLGVIAFERGDAGKAAACWEESLKREENPWACRNLALAAAAEGKLRAAAAYYKRALALPGGEDRSFAEEYIPLLLDAGMEDEAAAELAERVRSCPLDALPLPLIDAAARIAFSRGDDALLDRIFSLEPAHIREGNTTLADIWIERETRRSPRSRRSALLAEPLLPPLTIDFRMYTGPDPEPSDSRP